MKHTCIMWNDVAQRWDRVAYWLTWREEFEYIKAHVAAFCLGGCPANHMSADLERILCSHGNERQRTIEEDV